jgi:hypothetical protein
MSVANPQFNAWKTNVLMTMLITNPTATSFPMGINGGYIANGNAGAAMQDVTRQQVLNELANRVADEKTAGTSANITRVVVDFASPVGANNPSPALGTPNYVLNPWQCK